MQTKQKDNLLFIRLFKEENVYESLKDALKKHNVITGVFLSCVGQLKEIELGFFKEKGNYVPEKFTNPYELLSLTGNVSKGEFHLHAILSDENKKTIGGHFISAIVSVTAEIIILTTDLEVKREIEEWNGLKGMFLE